MIRKNVLHLVRRRLRLKNLADFVESRSSMLGVSNLSIHTVIDIGANHGRLTRAYRRRFPQAQVLAVEPVPTLYRGLAAWAQRHGDAVRVFNVALSSAPSESTFYVCRKSTIWSTMLPPGEAQAKDFDAIRVKVDTLDNLVRPLELRDDILIKIDTEGYDLEVIRGGRETLSRTAAVVVETTFFPTGYGEQAPIFEDILAELATLGFCYRGNTRCCWNGGTCMGADALFVHRRAAGRLAG